MQIILATICIYYTIFSSTIVLTEWILLSPVYFNKTSCIWMADIIRFAYSCFGNDTKVLKITARLHYSP